MKNEFTEFLELFEASWGFCDAILNPRCDATVVMPAFFVHFNPLKG